MQAAIGVEQLKKLPNIIKRRKENFELLFNEMKKYQEYFVLPIRTDNSDPSWFGFHIQLKEDAPFNRSEIVKHMESKGIATRMLFGGNLTKQPAYKGIKFKEVGPLTNTDLIMNNLFWIGVYPGLTEEIIQYMLSAFQEFFQEIKAN